MKNNKIITQPKSSSFLKNEMRMKLLALLPSFQRDVGLLRSDFGIPKDGFVTDEEVGDWHESIGKISDDFQKNKGFRKKLIKILSALRKCANSKQYSELEKKREELENSIPFNVFRQKISELGKKYHLPANFYFDPKRDVSDPSRGLVPYVFRNIILVPSNNWVVEHDVSGLWGGGKFKNSARWVSIKIFAPLDKKELQEAIWLLKQTQSYRLSLEVNIPTRKKAMFDRDLEIVKRLSIKESCKPIKSKGYVPGSYLDLVTKKGNLTSEKKRELERLNKGDVTVKFNAPISKEVAKELKMTPEAVRKARERLRKIAEKFFGKDAVRG